MLMQAKQTPNYQINEKSEETTGSGKTYKAKTLPNIPINDE